MPPYVPLDPCGAGRGRGTGRPPRDRERAGGRAPWRQGVREGQLVIPLVQETQRRGLHAARQAARACGGGARRTRPPAEPRLPSPARRAGSRGTDPRLRLPPACTPQEFPTLLSSATAACFHTVSLGPPVRTSASSTSASSASSTSASRAAPFCFAAPKVLLDPPAAAAAAAAWLCACDSGPRHWPRPCVAVTLPFRFSAPPPYPLARRRRHNRSHTAFKSHKRKVSRACCRLPKSLRLPAPAAPYAWGVDQHARESATRAPLTAASLLGPVARASSAT